MGLHLVINKFYELPIFPLNPTTIIKEKEKSATNFNAAVIVVDDVVNTGHQAF